LFDECGVCATAEEHVEHTRRPPESQRGARVHDGHVDLG
jgi:hypothetical protein